jgi:cyclase
VEDIRALLLAGADKVSINTGGREQPALRARGGGKFGTQCIVVAIDAKRVSAPGERGRWEIFTHGGRTATGIDAVAFAQRVAPSAPASFWSPPWTATAPRRVRPGLHRAIADAVSIPVIASGGVGGLDDLVAGVQDGHASAVLAASIFHFGEHSIAEAKRYMAHAGLPMRMIT